MLGGTQGCHFACAIQPSSWPILKMVAYNSLKCRLRVSGALLCIALLRSWQLFSGPAFDRAKS